MIVLDTHALLWWIEDRGRLSKTAAAAIVQHSPAVVSPISFWEIAVLIQRGRIEIDRELMRWSRDLLADGATRVAALTPTVAIAAGQLPNFHGDPADRFIYATARELEVPLLSKDSQIRQYASRSRDVQVIW
jgi:PIN domain nuclease of toxin-antitoxin system